MTPPDPTADGSAARHVLQQILLDVLGTDPGRAAGTWRAWTPATAEAVTRRVATDLGVTVTAAEIARAADLDQLVAVVHGRATAALDDAFAAAFAGDAADSTGAADAGTDTAAATAAPAAAFPRSARGGRPPASFGQERLWLAERLRPGTSEYVVPVVLRLRGHLDAGAMSRALDELVGRHEVLRTQLVEDGGRIVQVVRDPAPVGLRHERGVADEIVAREAAEPFDLATDPLLRAVLVTGDDEDDNVLVLVTHHTMFDNWSVAILVEELDALYAAAAGGTDHGLAEPGQYADFAAWQREQARGPSFEADLDRWRTALAGSTPVPLATDRPRPRRWDPRGGSVWGSVPASLATRLRALGRDHAATPFMVFMTAYQVLLARHTHSTDVTVGSSVAARDLPETERMLGFFVNTLPFRADLSGDPSFAAALTAGRHGVLGALSRQHVPFDVLVRELAPARSLAENPFFNTMLVLQNTGATDRRFRIGDLDGEFLRPSKVTAQFDLHVTLHEQPDGSFSIRLDYATALFERGSATGLVARFVRLLEEIADRPSAPISRLDAGLPTALPTGSSAGRTTEQAAAVHLLFGRSAAASPERTAVVCGEQHLSYRELDERSTGLAHALRARGLRPGEVAAVLLPRGLDAVVAVLGVLKAGGAYLPLDVATPLPRIRRLLDDAAPVVLVSEPGLIGDADLGEHARHLVTPGETSDDPGSPLDAAVDGRRPAYLIYTSGSTGRPKAVEVSHDALANRVWWAVVAHGFGPHDAMLHRSSLAFDAAGWEIFTPLACGATVVVAPQAVHRNAAALLDVCLANAVTVLQVVPALLETLLRLPDLDRAVHLRRIFCAGEVLRPQLVADLRRRLPGTLLVNTYGPTECAIDVCSWDCTDEADGAAGADGDVPIGRPLDNVQLHLLDASLLPVPQGTDGELCVGGVQVGSGYRARPGLTAERFVPDPFSEVAGARMYRTGDLARDRGDGALVFRGRLDDQLKVRGFRIEPGEVEAAVASHPAVRTTVVTAEGAGAERQLVAHVVLQHQGSPASEVRAVREHLERTLPSHLVPDRWSTWPELPLNANGKVDRQALQSGGTTAVPDQAPATPTAGEDALSLMTSVWAEVLGADEVGPDEDFFERGGNSLLAVRMLGALRDRGVDAGGELLQVLFERRTARGVAATVAVARPAADADGPADTRPDASSGASSGEASGDASDPALGLVTSVWAEVLGVAEVGPDEDFFERGGNSLLAVRMLGALRDRGVDADGELLQVLFERRTARGVAAALPTARPDPAEAVTTTPATPATPTPPAATRREVIAGRVDAGRAPLSFAQERLWFLERLRPGTAEYVVPVALRLHGPVDVDRFDAALVAVVNRHEALRSRVHVVDGVPEQRFPLVDGPLLDVVEVSAQDWEAAGAAEAARPFDLRTDPLVRATLLRLGPAEHVLMLVLHHLVFDGWSLPILLADLGEAYAALQEGRAPRWRPVEVGYGDYAAWQRGSPEVVAGPATDYWKERLRDLDVTELPADRPRPREWQPLGRSLELPLPAEPARRFLAWARARGATPFTAFLSLFEVLLARTCGRGVAEVTDVTVGTPVAGRTRPELAHTVGMFANTVVLRTPVDPDARFDVFLASVRETVEGAFLHQDVPFERLVEELAPQRDLSRNPLFQLMFVLDEEAQASSVAAADLRIEAAAVGNDTAKFDQLWTVVARADGSYLLDVQYATTLFDEATVRRTAEHYVRLLTAVAADPGTRLGSVELLSPAERDELDRQHEVHRARTEDAAPSRFVFDHVLAAAERRPEAVAVIDGAEEIGYRRLLDRAAGLARRLAELGVGVEDVVAVAMPRSGAVVTALLATLQLGATYVPFDADHPRQRQAFVLTDTGARVVLTHSSLRDRLPDVAGVVVVAVDELDLDDAGDVPGGVPAVPPRAALHDQSAAYVIHTSGSTGVPKGAVISHAAYAHHCLAVRDPYRLGPDARVLLLSAFTFDIAMDQIGATLCAGGTVVVADPGRWAPRDLLDRIAAYGVTTVEMTPGPFRQVMQDADGADPRLATLRVMNVGSEVVTYQDAAAWTGTGLPGTFLCNYGPTEATVTCTLFPVDAEAVSARPPGVVVPIGRPIAGTEAYVASPSLGLLPPGMPGELLIGGPRVGRGYHGRPGLTADRFVPHPLGSAGERVYRTGDLVVQRADGAFAFLGRLDQQVKIRGFRIELGEVEAAMGAYPGVTAAAAAAHGEGADRVLVGYVVPGREAVDFAALREFVAERLPAYLVPTVWEEIPALPVTSSGKLDRRSLPEPSGPHASMRQAYVAPSTEAEEAVAAMWSEVLGVDRVGTRDRFFDLGGHSLLATRLFARLNRHFDVELPLRTIFDTDTVEGLARAVEDAILEQISGLTDEEVALRLGEGEGGHEPAR